MEESVLYFGRQQPLKTERMIARDQLREILDDLDRQDRALLRVSSDLLSTIARLKEAHELSLKHADTRRGDVGDTAAVADPVGSGRGDREVTAQLKSATI